MKQIKNKKETDIQFDSTLRFEGRNGYFYSIGIGVDNWADDHIAIFPYTSKGIAGRCEIQIEKSKIGELIDVLEKLK